MWEMDCEIDVDVKEQEEEMGSWMTAINDRKEEREKAIKNEKKEKSGMAGRNQMDMVQFGLFVAGRRTELGMTQMQLAEKLYVTNKAVSKWERGVSMPDVALLEPLAEALGVTVTELLHGQSMAEEQKEAEITDEELIRLIKGAGELPEEDREKIRGTKKKRLILYLGGMVLSVAEVTALYLLGDRLGISTFDLSLDLLIIIPLVLFIGIWPVVLMPDRLPELYDKMRISEYSDGFFQLSVPGVYFNNRNWPHIIKALRTFCLLVPVLWPIAYVPVRLLVPDFLWLFGRIAVILAVTLGGLFVPVVAMAKKYE